MMLNFFKHPAFGDEQNKIEKYDHLRNQWIAVNLPEDAWDMYNYNIIGIDAQAKNMFSLRKWR
jgi:hypothetical protein